MPHSLASNYKSFRGTYKFQLEDKQRGLVLQMLKWVNLPKILNCHKSRSIINQRYENCLREGKI